MVHAVRALLGRCRPCPPSCARRSRPRYAIQRATAASFVDSGPSRLWPHASDPTAGWRVALGVCVAVGFFLVRAAELRCSQLCLLPDASLQGLWTLGYAGECDRRSRMAPVCVAALAPAWHVFAGCVCVLWHAVQVRVQAGTGARTEWSSVD